MSTSPGEITLLLSDLKNPDSIAQLMRLVYHDLRQMAGGKCRHERLDSSLQPTALVNEAYIRLMESGVTFKNRRYFFGAASKAMRRILIDHIRKIRAEKRGGEWQRVDIEDAQLIGSRDPDEWLALDQALTHLDAAHPSLREVVELRIFGGFTAKEAADILDVAEITVRRRWETAQNWLKAEIPKYLDRAPKVADHG